MLGKTDHKLRVDDQERMFVVIFLKIWDKEESQVKYAGMIIHKSIHVLDIDMHFSYSSSFRSSPGLTISQTQNLRKPSTFC